jgi:hypothetical protein
VDTKNLVKKVTARDREINFLLGGGVSQFRLHDSIDKRTEQFDKRVKTCRLWLKH